MSAGKRRDDAITVRRDDEISRRPRSIFEASTRCDPLGEAVTRVLGVAEPARVGPGCVTDLAALVLDGAGVLGGEKTRERAELVVGLLRQRFGPSLLSIILGLTVERCSQILIGGHQVFREYLGDSFPHALLRFDEPLLESVELRGRVDAGVLETRARDDAVERVVVARRDRVELVIVAARARDGESRERFADDVDHAFVDARLVGVDVGWAMLAVRQEQVAGTLDRLVLSCLGVEARLLEQVARDGLAQELIVGDVSMKGADQVVAVAVRVRHQVVGLESFRLGEAHEIHPVPRPLLAEVGRGEQSIHDSRVGGVPVSC